MPFPGVTAGEMTSDLVHVCLSEAWMLQGSLPVSWEGGRQELFSSPRLPVKGQWA